jgi:predicted transcriptional regulator YdeE
MRWINASLWVLLCSAGSVLAGPATQPAQKDAPPADESVISKMRVQEFKAQTYLFAETQTTLAEIGPVVTDLMAKLHAAVKDGHVNVTGPAIFVYQGATQDMNKPFTLQVGFSVAPETKPVAEFNVRPLDKLKSATVLYSGPVAQVGAAYQQVFTDLFAAGLEPTGETREYYLYWEAPESPNNVELIQVGVK